ncbi:hypothetical protein P5E90_11745 [Clostridium perfringens]|nr:hypothetical protein [Clostridium perfringens]
MRKIYKNENLANILEDLVYNSRILNDILRYGDSENTHKEKAKEYRGYIKELIDELQIRSVTMMNFRSYNTVRFVKTKNDLKALLGIYTVEQQEIVKDILDKISKS